MPNTTKPIYSLPPVTLPVERCTATPGCGGYREPTSNGGDRCDSRGDEHEPWELDTPNPTHRPPPR